MLEMALEPPPEIAETLQHAMQESRGVCLWSGTKDVRRPGATGKNVSPALLKAECQFCALCVDRSWWRGGTGSLSAAAMKSD